MYYTLEGGMVASSKIRIFMETSIATSEFYRV